MELSKCPFCGGMAGVSSRQMKFLGQNYIGWKKIRYAAYGKCKKCYARGPIVTEVINTENSGTNEALTELYRKAEEAWERRTP